MTPSDSAGPKVGGWGLDDNCAQLSLTVTEL